MAGGGGDNPLFLGGTSNLLWAYSSQAALVTHDQRGHITVSLAGTQPSGGGGGGSNSGGSGSNPAIVVSGYDHAVSLQLPDGSVVGNLGWTVAADLSSISFELKAETGNTAGGWVGLGFPSAATSSLMVGSDAVIGWSSSSGNSLGGYTLSGYAVNQVQIFSLVPPLAAATFPVFVPAPHLLPMLPPVLSPGDQQASGLH